MDPLSKKSGKPTRSPSVSHHRGLTVVAGEKPLSS